MTHPDEQVVNEVVQRLVSALPIEKIILFGSRARGEAKQDSDFDFLVIMDTDLSPLKRNVEIRKVGRVKGYPMDFLVRTPEEMANGFIMQKEIAAEGVVVYER
ncbi:nucleotidyltransferase domain-containing protein [Fodinisporobacter ferrooxydans]|uniref:Nucleotidyltransferase domain-containing protein n=1 Tax=Fodinisporobacter ferrooxydans TaxID=2901836 RepID=A0ABY4CMI3_9BACL|nr:nucleotidyltransferase domain-containing protein [Alicyclobacillaceae bacterium MYW30-H2]